MTIRKPKSRIDSIKAVCPFAANWLANTTIASIADYFAVVDAFLQSPTEYWFRGLHNCKYDLVPSALRYVDEIRRTKAIVGLQELKRLLPSKIDKAPEPDDDFGWCQLAQHYGFPTRLLDWTRNPASALYFVCAKDHDKDGQVVAMQPSALNGKPSDPSFRIYNPFDQNDKKLIRSYFTLDGKLKKRGGKRNIAIESTNNSARVIAQHGTFTLHGDQLFQINKKQVPSLVCIPIFKEYKLRILQQLDAIGVGEMYLFPEAEHICSHIRARHGL